MNLEKQNPKKNSRQMPQLDRPQESGSALVVVMGILAVIMLMATAFSIFMRTERAGTTNLRHSILAEQMIHSSIARVMESIDASFESPASNSPAVYWREPFLASSAPPSDLTASTNGYAASRYMANNAERGSNARILSREMMMHLTPSQYALAKNARVEWVTMKSSLESNRNTDQILGRYAFLAFDVSGLMDYNEVGGGDVADRKKDTGNDPYNFQVNGDSSWEPNFWKSSKWNNSRYPNYSNFDSRREQLPFTSMASFWRAFGINNGPENYKFKRNELIAGDLFTEAPFSLEAATPDGVINKLPIVLLPSNTSQAKKEEYAEKLQKQFEKMFIDSGDYYLNDNVKTVVPIIKKKNSQTPVPTFSRADLATQALLDYMDEDNIPGGVVPSSGNDYLNYPCTEPIPMITQATAHFEIVEAEHIQDDPSIAGYTDYKVKFFIRCYAQLLNDHIPANLAGKKYQLEMQYQCEEGSFVDALWPPNSEWKILDKNGGENRNNAFRFLEGQTYTVTCDPKEVKATTAAQRAIWCEDESHQFTVRVPDREIVAGQTYQPRKFSKLEEEGSKADVDPPIEFRMTARVISEGKVLQQVPCPLLEECINGRNAQDFRIKLTPALYYNEDDYKLSDRARERVDNAGPEDKYYSEFEYGWALCLDPRFAYYSETMWNGLATQGGCAFWITNEDAKYDLCEQSNPELKKIGERIRDNEFGGGYDDIPNGGLGNQLMKPVFYDFLKDKPATVKKFFGEMATPISNDQKIYPDFFHTINQGGTMFAMSDNNNEIFKTRITNLPMKSVGELGNLVIGPWETLSLFETFKPGAAQNDMPLMHTVLDYFTVPDTTVQTPSQALASQKPAVQKGRINLNAQRLVKVSQENPLRVESPMSETGRFGKIPLYNSDPLTALWTGTSINTNNGTTVSAEVAHDLAEAFYDRAITDLRKELEDAGCTASNLIHHVNIRRLSDLGRISKASGESDVLRILDDEKDNGDLAIQCDAHREALLVNSVNGMTTRGQNFLVMVRAEAYLPRFGTDSAEGGTTLSRRYALVHLWRDPEPLRDANGDIKEPISHAWIIRSVRLFDN